MRNAAFSLLWIQLLIIASCLSLLGMQLWYFPYPSPLIRPFLDPPQRWPEAQVKEWVESGNYQPAFVSFFMRDPERVVPKTAGIVSPADGIVKEIVRSGETVHFVVGLSFWDVHVVRTPVPGVVTAIVEEGFSVFRDRSETADLVFLRGKQGPVQSVVSLEDQGISYNVRLITSWWASRIKVSARVGQRLSRGDRIGRILLGSSVVLDAPPSTEFLSLTGQRVVAGESMISSVPK